MISLARDRGSDFVALAPSARAIPFSDDSRSKHAITLKAKPVFDRNGMKLLLILASQYQWSAKTVAAIAFV
ncbi:MULTISPECIES: hypothetical protein [Rhizobium]|uniref:hypothetical protein n=1 Tax=Rhizobium TaxID=379 RepID=UPI001F36D2D9|nr:MULTISPECIES: hypothetical protein [Rhizobium]